MSDKLLSDETLDNILNCKLSKLQKCKDVTKSYIFSVLKKYINKYPNYLDNKIVGLEYLKAAYIADFVKFQDIGDWIFFVRSNYPDFFDKSSSNYYISIGQSSYYRCHKLLNKKWPLFEELADNFTEYANLIYIVELKNKDNL